MGALKINGVELSSSVLVVLLASTVVTLSSGTNYVVGSWAPQFADQLHLSSSQVNLIAAFGNFGVYLTGPLFGYVADKHGPRGLTFAGAALLGAGYLGLWHSYRAKDPQSVPFALLAAFSFTTALGSSCGMVAGLNAIARNFGPETRGTAMGIVVAGYGLSAFLYASISGYIVGDDTQAFLLILAIGTFCSLFVSGILLADRKSHHYAPVVSSPESAGMYRTLSARSQGEDDSEGHEDSGSLSMENKSHKELTGIGGVSLLRSADFLVLLVITFALTGTGLMWINSVGTVVVTLAQFNGTVGKVSRMQAHQTSLLSVFNCFGRLFTGFVSDKAGTMYGTKPVWWLSFMSLTFLLSQWLAESASDLSSLSWATSFVGFSYGQFFGLAPLLLLDYFGMKHFSSNVGSLYMVPTLSSYVFSHLFGAIYDSNIPDVPESIPDDHSHVCALGRLCYVQVFTFTMSACVLALALSVLLALRTSQRAQPKAENDRDVAQ